MATINICVQKQRKDGFWPVYIRITHNGRNVYVKTDKVVNDKGLTKSREVKDPYVLQSLNRRVVEWIERLNKVDIETWTVHQVHEYLKSGEADICFSDFARKHNAEMINNGMERNARTYRQAYQSLERFAGTTRLMFSQMTSQFIAEWIKSMGTTHRAKQHYPICIRQIFKAAQLEYNDYDNGIIRIKTNPWPKVKIPKADVPQKLAITPQECRRFFSAPLPESKLKSPLSEIGRDVAMLVLCLAGMNTVDIFNLKKTDYVGGILHYRRAKTKKFRTDGAYIEMRVPPIIRPILDKYATPADDPYLLSFHNRFCDSDSFGSGVNAGIKQICQRSLGMSKEESYCVYTFRHTWGTIAQNDCGASIHDVAFAMNHSAGHEITRGYLKLDFSPAWVLNEKVVDLIFFSEVESHRPEDQETEMFRFSAKHLIRATVFSCGHTLGDIEDTGFNNIDEVIAALAKYIPDTVPPRSILHFKIEIVDKGLTQIYERMKGHGC